MPSPLGHSLLGLAFTQLPLRDALYRSWPWLLFVVFAANAPDLDFIVGWCVGDINRFHHGISHSLGFALIFALCCCMIARMRSGQYKKVFFVALLAYVSHLLGDYIAIDRVEPFGEPLFWPLSDEYFMAAQPLFKPIQHGQVGQHSQAVFDKIFSLANFNAVLFEALIILPAWVLVISVIRLLRK